MPGRNIIKPYAQHSFYHLYTRGVDKQTIFKDEHDYTVFLGLLKRYLSASPSKNLSRHTYVNYGEQLELLCYALMSNHVHMLIYQHDERTISQFMRSLMTSYSMYFNKRYKRVGPVFQSRYRGVIIDSDSYLYHISRYIHRNPTRWRHSPHTSIGFVTGEKQADWVRPGRIIELFKNTTEYLAFLEDYDPKQDDTDLEELVV